MPAGGRLEPRAGPERAALRGGGVAAAPRRQDDHAQDAGPPHGLSRKGLQDSEVPLSRQASLTRSTSVMPDAGSVNGTGRAAPAAATDGFGGVRNHEQVSGS